MSRARAGSVLTVAAVVCMSVLIAGQERDRAKVDNKYKWNLADIYPSVAAWRTQKEKVTAEIPSVQKFAGTLGSSPQALANALETMTRLDKELSRLYVYASMLADEDTRLSDPQGMQQEMQQIYAEFGAQAAYIEPEVLKIGKAAVDRRLAHLEHLRLDVRGLRAELRVDLLHLLLHPLRVGEPRIFDGEHAGVDVEPRQLLVQPRHRLERVGQCLRRRAERSGELLYGGNLGGGLLLLRPPGGDARIDVRQVPLVLVIDFGAIAILAQHQHRHRHYSRHREDRPETGT